MALSPCGEGWILRPAPSAGGMRPREHISKASSAFRGRPTFAIGRPTVTFRLASLRSLRMTSIITLALQTGLIVITIRPVCWSTLPRIGW